jgi:hypothetical protein
VCPFSCRLPRRHSTPSHILRGIHTHTLAMNRHRRRHHGSLL